MVVEFEEQAERYTVLEDPQRRRIYLYVRAAHRAVTRDEVAEGLAISRSLAAFHLDRLLDAGLLRAHYARPPGVGGPGAGRPAKRYQTTDVELRLSLPARHYDLAGQILARAVDEAGKGDAAARARELAYAEGRQLGAAQRHEGAARPRPALAAAADLAEHLGYEPLASDGDVVLTSCPFHALVAAAPHLVCSLNQSLLAGALDGLGLSGAVSADLDPGDQRCCVLLRPA